MSLLFASAVQSQFQGGPEGTRPTNIWPEDPPVLASWEFWSEGTQGSRHHLAEFPDKWRFEGDSTGLEQVSEGQNVWDIVRAYSSYYAIPIRREGMTNTDFPRLQDGRVVFRESATLASTRQQSAPPLGPTNASYLMGLLNLGYEKGTWAVRQEVFLGRPVDLIEITVEHQKPGFDYAHEEPYSINLMDQPYDRS